MNSILRMLFGELGSNSTHSHSWLDFPLNATRCAEPHLACGHHHYSHMGLNNNGKLVLRVLQDQRLTPSRKRSQMLLLVRDMTSAQSSFNARVLALRDEKRGLLARLNAARQRLSVINNLLGITGGQVAGGHS